MNIYLSSSWKNRHTVREITVSLRNEGHEVYDFTDPKYRKTEEIPPEKFPDNFDPLKHIYSKYINSNEQWLAAVEENKKAIENCDIIIMILPCGNDAHADAYYGLGIGKLLIIVGQPRKDERSTTHLWAHKILDTFDQLIPFIEAIEITSSWFEQCGVIRKS